MKYDALKRDELLVNVSGFFGTELADNLAAIFPGHTLLTGVGRTDITTGKKLITSIVIWRDRRLGRFSIPLLKKTIIEFRSPKPGILEIFVRDSKIIKHPMGVYMVEHAREDFCSMHPKVKKARVFW